MKIRSLGRHNYGLKIDIIKVEKQKNGLLLADHERTVDTTVRFIAAGCIRLTVNEIKVHIQLLLRNPNIFRKYSVKYLKWSFKHISFYFITRFVNPLAEPVPLR